MGFWLPKPGLRPPKKMPHPLPLGHSHPKEAQLPKKGSAPPIRDPPSPVPPGGGQEAGRLHLRRGGAELHGAQGRGLQAGDHRLGEGVRHHRLRHRPAEGLALEAGHRPGPAAVPGRWWGARGGFSGVPCSVGHWRVVPRGWGEVGCTFKVALNQAVVLQLGGWGLSPRGSPFFSKAGKSQMAISQSQIQIPNRRGWDVRRGQGTAGTNEMAEILEDPGDAQAEG